MKNISSNSLKHKKYLSFLALYLCSAFLLMDSPCFSMDEEQENRGRIRFAEENLDHERPRRRQRMGEVDQVSINQELRDWLNQNFRNNAGEFLGTVDREATRPTYAKEIRENLKQIHDNVRMLLQARWNIQSAISPLHHEYDEVKNIFSMSGGFIGISDIKAALGNHHPSIIKVASTFLLLDQDLNYQGTFCIFKADHWKVLGTRSINLSGAIGLNGADGNAQEMNGQPGNPGGNGGKFTGFMLKYEKMDNLTINVDGGRGGNGGNGAAGINGTNGVDADPTALPSFVLLGQGTPYQYNIGLQGVHVLGVNALCDYTLNGTRVLYQNSGTPGTAGGNGGYAGRGGRGGYGGNITWKANNFTLQQMMRNGVDGNNGIPGVGGRGGRHGHYSQRHKLTNMSCTAVAGGPFAGATGTNNVSDIWEPAYFITRGYAADGAPGQLSNVLPQDPPAQTLLDAVD